MDTLSEFVQWFCELPEGKLTASKVSLATAVNMHRIANGEEGAYVVFNNGMGPLFEIWRGKMVVESILHDENFMWRIYGWRLDDQDELLVEPVWNEYGYIEFVRRKEKWTLA